MIRGRARRQWRRGAGVVAGAVACWGAGPRGAVAQTFEKFNESTRDQLPASPFVAGAYAFIWLALLAYVFFVARSVRRTEDEVRALARRLHAELGDGGDGRADSRHVAPPR